MRKLVPRPLSDPIFEADGKRAINEFSEPVSVYEVLGVDVSGEDLQWLVADEHEHYYIVRQTVAAQDEGPWWAIVSRVPNDCDCENELSAKWLTGDLTIV